MMEFIVHLEVAGRLCSSKFVIGQYAAVWIFSSARRTSTIAPTHCDPICGFVPLSHDMMPSRSQNSHVLILSLELSLLHHSDNLVKIVLSCKLTSNLARTGYLKQSTCTVLLITSGHEHTPLVKIVSRELTTNLARTINLKQCTCTF